MGNVQFLLSQMKSSRSQTIGIFKRVFHTSLTKIHIPFQTPSATVHEAIWIASDSLRVCIHFILKN